MIPPPKNCTYCDMEGKMKLISFKALESQKLRDGECGHPIYLKWVCLECENIFKKNELNKYYTIKGSLLLLLELKKKI